MSEVRPILVALPLDHETAQIVATVAELATRLEAPVVIAHAIAPRRLEKDDGLAVRTDEVRRQLEDHLAPLRDRGVKLLDVSVEPGGPPEVVVTAALRCAAQMIVTGGGRPATVRRWVVGSVAEAVVRRSLVPVWVVRGGPPAGRPLLCPIDFSPESRLGLESAVCFARLFELPLRLVTVVSEEPSRGAVNAQSAAYDRLEALVGEYGVDDLDLSMSVTVGDPAQRVVEAADDAGLMVVASRGYDPLIRDWLGPVTSRTLRFSQCSTLTIRHLAEGHDERMHSITRLADLHEQAKALLADGRAKEAMPMLEALAEQAPTNSAIQQSYAIGLDHVGRHVEATSRRELASLIDERLTSMP